MPATTTLYLPHAHCITIEAQRLVASLMILSLHHYALSYGFLLLMTQMLPEALRIIPIYAMYQCFNLKESLPNLGLIDTAFVLPLGIWILKNMLDTPIDRVLAVALFFSIFPVIFYVAVQRYMVAGLSASTIKGYAQKVCNRETHSF